MLHFWAAAGNHSFLQARFSGPVEFWRDDISVHVNDPDVDKWTPLHWACRSGSPQVVTLLLENGANKNARTSRGWQPLDVAIYHGRTLFDNSPELESLLQPDDGNATSSSTITSGTSPDIALGDEAVVDDSDEEEALPTKQAELSTRIASDDGTTPCFCDSCSCVSAIPYLLRQHLNPPLAFWI
jgi:hypothetical protein